MTENDTTPEEEEEYQGTTIGKEKGKNIISEELLGQQCSMEERGGIHTVNLIKGGSSKWGNAARSSLKLYIENISVKRLSDEEVANLAEEYRAYKIQQCLATVLKPMKYKSRYSRGGVQSVTNRNKEHGIFTKIERFAKTTRGGPLRRRISGSENLPQHYF